MLILQLLRRGNGDGGEDLFSQGTSDRICGNGSKIHQGMIRLDIKKHLFIERVIKSWNTLPSKVVNVLSLSMAKMPLDNDLNNMLYLSLGPELVRQLDQMIVA